MTRFLRTARPHDPRTSFSLSKPADTTRRCPKCGELRGLDEFAVDASKSSGRKSHCKVCDNAKARAYYARNRAPVLARVNERNRRLREARGV